MYIEQLSCFSFMISRVLRSCNRGYSIMYICMILIFAKDLYEIGNTRFSYVQIDYGVSIIIPIDLIHYFANTISPI